ncbi:MAG TPA: VOC family protein [Bryobacteraceae bacterium]|nr:VOC family protein [Bryobacteraceae bacterium]
MKPQFGLAVQYVTDIESAKRFYVDVLGLEVQRQAPDFIQFQNFAIAGDAPLGGHGEPELFWLVDDAEAAFQEMSKKADVSLPLKQQPFGKVFGIKDPAGHPCYVLELARHRPSKPV